MTGKLFRGASRRPAYATTDAKAMVARKAKADRQDRLPGRPEQTDQPKAEDLIGFVTDRPGHDMRYAIDARKIHSEMGWSPKQDSESGFRKTVQWYLSNRQWWEKILSGEYKLERLGKA